MTGIVADLRVYLGYEAINYVAGYKTRLDYTHLLFYVSKPGIVVTEPH